MRHFSSATIATTATPQSGTEGGKNSNSGIMAAFDKHKKALIMGTKVTAGMVTIYGISSMLYNITSSLLTLTPYASLYYGFIGGMITAGAGTTMVMNSVKLTHLHPDTALNAALAVLNESMPVQDAIGVRKQYNSELIKAIGTTQEASRCATTVPTGPRPRWSCW